MVGAVVAVLALGASGAFVFWRKLRPLAPVEPTREVQQLPGPVPPELRVVLKNVSLPFSTHGLERTPSANVVIDREAIYIDALRVAALEPLRAGAKRQRVDAVFNNLKAQRTAWLAAHPNEEFTGVVSLWVDEGTSLLALKSVFQTSAFAGYPNAIFVTRSRSQPAKLHQLNVDARVPGPPGQADQPRERILAVRARADGQVELAWMGEGLELQERLASLKDVGAATAELWNRRPAGIPVSTRPEQSRLFVAHELLFRDLVQVVDGLWAARFRKASDGADEGPVFNVEFIINYDEKSARELAGEYLRHTGPPRIRFEATTVSGRLHPEKIQGVVRRSFTDFRHCYEPGLARNPNLAGRVAVEFVIRRDGSVSNAVAKSDSTLADKAVERCIVNAFGKLVFPEPEGGIVTVVYPIQLAPG